MFITEIDISGQIYSISAAHSSRFACAYFPEGMTDSTLPISSIKVGVFECESSGGVEWLCEDTIIVNLRHNMRFCLTIPWFPAFVNVLLDNGSFTKVKALSVSHKGRYR